MKNYVNSKKKSLVMATSIVLLSMVLIPIVTGEIDNVQISDGEIVNIDESFIDPASFASHHKVLAEFGTTTSCPYCVSHKNYLPLVAGDFQYITLVANMNSAASSRCGELGISGVPDTYFDGKYTHVLGGVSSVSPLQNAYNVCQSRTVADIDVTLFAVWDSVDSTIDTTVYIDNTGGSTYNGHLHVYVIEKLSRWVNSNDGGNYHNAMLGYAINKNIIVDAGDTLIESSNTFSFPAMDQSNILVVATVFTQSTNYVDETDIAEPSSGGDDDDDDDDDNGPPLLIPKTKITEPGTGDIINDTVTISGTSHHPEGDQKIKWTMVKIDDGAWVETDDTIYWSLEWDTNTVEDGPHVISAVCSDGVKQSGIYQVNVEVRNDEEEPPDPEKIPDLDGEGTISWSGIKPKLVITSEFIIENTGDSESELDWEIGDTPDWGDWTFMPDEGYDLTPEDGEITVDVLLVAPDEKNQEFSGEIKVVNKQDGSDYITIPVSLTTTKYKGFDLYPFILRFFEQHPMLFPIIRILLGL